MEEEIVNKAIEECQLSPDEVDEIKKNPVVYESAVETVNISIDDVVTKKQKEKRNDSEKGDEGSDGKQYVHDTVAHIQQGKEYYVINGYKVVGVLRTIIGLLLNNDLLKYRLLFFVDGQKSLQSAILRAFSWFSNIGMILDWYHLLDKCKMQLSMGIKGRHKRNDVLYELSRLLWHGMVDKSMTDSGDTWTECDITFSGALYTITSSSDGTRLAAAGYNTYIYTSTDGGATWTERTSAGIKSSWYSIISSSNGMMLAAVVGGQSIGYIYTSTDGGANWTENTSAGSRNWYGITSSSDGDKLAAVANGGYIYTRP